MRHLLVLSSAVALLAGGVTGQGLPLAVPPAADSALPFPVTTPPPAWIVPGTRLTFTTIAGSLPSGEYDYEPDPDGRWADEAGNRFKRLENAGTGSAGYLQANVLALEGQQVAVQMLFYLFDGLDPERTTETTELGFVANAGCGGDLWLHPDALQQLLKKGAQGLVVLPLSFPIEKATYRAVMLSWRRAQGRGTWIYDLDSGVLLYACDVSKPGARQTQNGTLLSEGATILRCTKFKGSRQVDVPWAKAPMPAAVLQARGFDYRARLTVRPVAVDTPLPFQLGYDVAQRGTGWLVAKLRAPDLLPGMDVRVRSGHQFTGLWVPPEHCARLQPGQVLDRDPVVKTTVSVTYVDADVVTISQQGPRQDFQFTYRKRDGVLARGQFTEHMPITPGAPQMSRVVEMELATVR